MLLLVEVGRHSGFDLKINLNKKIMTRLLKRKAGKLTLMDAFGIAITKTLGERILTPFIGNSTIISGGLKILGATLLTTMIGGGFGTIVGTALTVDGTEDIVNSFLGGGNLLEGFRGGGGNQTNIV